MLHTDRGELRSRTVIVAGGHGAFEPKKLPGYDMTPWEGRGAHYIVGEKSVFEGKRVMIVGGGDSAVRLGHQPARHGRLGHARAPPRGLPRARADRRPGARGGRPRRCDAARAVPDQRGRRRRQHRAGAAVPLRGRGRTSSRSRSTRSCSSSASRPRSAR